jgi:pyridine nucleotide-disulfide oxidoreductase domain-containing protein 1
MILSLKSLRLKASFFASHKVTKFLTDFDIEEQTIESFVESYTNLTIINSLVIDLNTIDKQVTIKDGSKYSYKKLCICSGGRPKLIDDNNEYVLGIRDTQTVFNFQTKLQKARQIVIVGNGGIATELAYEIEKCKIIWIIKDEFITHTFFDSTTAKFFIDKINRPKKETKDLKEPSKRAKYTISKRNMKDEWQSGGSALGPDWSVGLEMIGSEMSISHLIDIQYKCEIKSIYKRDEFLKLQLKCENDVFEWPVYVELSSGKIFGCDFIISATGVSPNIDYFVKNNKFNLADDGSLIVDDHMKTNIQDVYAAGDICTAGWQWSPYWHQMRLWSQARQMGDYAARSMFASMVNDEDSISLDFCFEMFAHITRFFSFKVILLGNYKAEGLKNDYEVLLRTTEDIEFIKIILFNNRVVGATLVGDTDLEETFENLILNQLDVCNLKDDLLNPDIEIDDYFD